MFCSITFGKNLRSIGVRRCLELLEINNVQIKMKPQIFFVIDGIEIILLEKFFVLFVSIDILQYEHDT